MASRINNGSSLNNNNSTSSTNKKWIRSRSNEPKSTDELNYEELREFAQESSNRYCFDCHQRGPTYVNMTIGSFICMRCSGLLRGLTPPHRVKSMSMATFTSDEMCHLQERGNDYCKQIWLQLFEGNVLTESSDEQDIRDFMIQKYERKRYYVDPKVSGVQLRVKPHRQHDSSTSRTGADDDVRRRQTTVNGFSHVSRHERDKTNNNNTSKSSISNSDEFIVDFSKADIFVAEPFKRPPLLNGFARQQTLVASPEQQQASFANFDNNPIFNSTTTTSKFITNTSNNNNHDSAMMIRPQYQSKLTSQLINNNNSKQSLTPPPSADRYAALKDLDDALKTCNINTNEQQHIIDWIGHVNNNNGVGVGGCISSSVSSVSSFGSPPVSGASVASVAHASTGTWNPFCHTSTSTSSTIPWMLINNNNSNNGNGSVVTGSPDQYNNTSQHQHHQHVNPFKTTTNQHANNNDVSLFTTINNPFKNSTTSSNSTAGNNTSPSSNKTISGVGVGAGVCGTAAAATAVSSISSSSPSYSNNPFL